MSCPKWNLQASDTHIIYRANKLKLIFSRALEKYCKLFLLIGLMNEI